MELLFFTVHFLSANSCAGSCASCLLAYIELLEVVEATEDVDDCVMSEFFSPSKAEA
jgi:hypothetical protein